ncbi:hypothetical protein DRO61_12815, partial [Candidatus Bathyarchaeota archaeon]
NISSGYFGGKAPEYSITQELDEEKQCKIKKLFDRDIGQNADSCEFQLIIDYIRDYNDDESFFFAIAKDYLITGACYGLLYENKDNEIVYSRASSRQCVAVYDYSIPTNMIGLIRVWEQTDDQGFKVTMVEITTKDKRVFYKNSKPEPDEYKLSPDMSNDINWKLVPALAIENPDNLGIFEPVLQLIDAYQQLIENNKNLFQYNDDAKLMVTGYSPDEPLTILDANGDSIINPARTAEDGALLENPVFYVQDSSGKIEWIIKEINDGATENYKKTLIDLILMTACIPNVTDTGFSNADNASAIQKKFFPLDQVLIQADKQFKAELLNLWENIIDRINTKKNTSFDFREISIEMQRNVPNEKQEIVDMALKLRGLLSDESVIRMLPLELDVDSELSKLKEQTEENQMDLFNNMSKTEEKEVDSEVNADVETNRQIPS